MDGIDAGRVTYLVIDGENLDATLGVNLLGHRPAPDERPRWERVLEFAQRRWSQPVKALFFLNASSGNLPMPFIQALTAMGLRPVPLSGPPGMKVVDVGIQRMLEAIVDRDADVVLFDPAITQTVHAKDLHGNCDYTLLEGRTLRGRVEKVFLRGILIVNGPHWLGREGMGRFVPRGEVRAF